VGNKDVLERRRANMRQYNKEYVNNHPYVREMKSVSSLKYMAKLRGDKDRVSALEKQYEELKRKKDEWRLQNSHDNEHQQHSVQNECTE